MQHEPVLQIGTDMAILPYSYHRPFMVRYRDKRRWQNHFKSDNTEGLVGTGTGPRPIKTLELGVDEVQKGA
jgi:hypothetical protein